MNKKNIKTTILSAIICASTLLSAQMASAAILTDGSYEYDGYNVNAPVYGISFTSHSGTSCLKPSSADTSFIKNKAKIVFDNGSYIEIGDIKGNITLDTGSIPAEGIGYIKCVKYDQATKTWSYTSEKIGEANPAGNSYKIARNNSDNYKWDIYFNNQIVKTVTENFDAAKSAYIGLESNDDTNTFTSGLYNENLQYKKTPDNWVNCVGDSNFSAFLGNNLNWRAGTDANDTEFFFINAR